MIDKRGQIASHEGQEFHKELAQEISTASTPLDLVPAFNGIELMGRKGSGSN